MANYKWSYERDKNFVIFTEEYSGKQYSFDINTGHLVNMATNRVLSAFPAGMGKYLDSYDYIEDGVVFLMGTIRYNPYRYNVPTTYGEYRMTKVKGYEALTSLFQIIDKIQHLGADCHGCYFADITPYKLQYINTHFKDFAKYCRSTENPSISDFFGNGIKILFRERNWHIISEYALTAEALDKLLNKWQYFEEHPNHLRLYCYFLSHGVYDFCEREAFTKIDEYFSFCEKAHLTPEKGDFFKLYIMAKQTYTLRKKEFDAKTLKEHYATQSNALLFEDDNLMVVLPASADDFQNEANYQSNCVYRSYFEPTLNGSCHIVFIRRKDNPTVPYITCEVRNGEICQYLTRYNCSVTDYIGVDFKKAYQQHLFENWK